jgi:hypothetical protein
MDITPTTTDIFTTSIQNTQDRVFRQYDELVKSFALTDGLMDQTALFDLDGNWVPAKLVDSKYGTSWLVLDENNRSTGVFVPFASKKRETQAKRGYVEGRVRVPAEVTLGGGFRPSCGISPVGPQGTTKPVSIITVDRFQEGN